MNIKTKTLARKYFPMLLQLCCAKWPKASQKFPQPQKSLDNFPGHTENFAAAAAAENSFDP